MSRRSVVRVRPLRLLPLLVVLLLLLPVTAVYAEETQPQNRELLEDQLDASGANDLYAQLPQETQELLQELGVSGLGEGAIYDLSLSGVLGLLGKLAGQAAGSAAKTALSVLGIVLLGALMQSTQQSPGGEETGKVFRVAEILLCAVLLLDPLTRLMDTAGATLKGATTFQLSFVPVFAAVMAAGGQTVSAGKYALLTVGASQTCSALLSGVVLPLLRMSAALSVTIAAAPGIRLDGLLALVRKVLTWLLGLMMTVFVGILSLQGAVGGAADSLADKTAQFLIGSAVPVVGGALSQAYSSVRGYVRLLKSTVGAFGMLAVAVMVLPQLVALLVWQLMLEGCAAVGDLFEQKELTALLRNLAALLGILVGVLLCGGLMMTVSVGVMLVVRGDT